MNEEMIDKARYYAARDIAHRWFSFFEGQTESLNSHLEIFSADVRLVHAGTHLLADGQASMATWLRNLPDEKGSHFIRSFDVIPYGENMATVNMSIGYQMVREDLSVDGALSEYETRVAFDHHHQAVFTFLQKTPRFDNPDKVFSDSFQENRLHSFIAHFLQLMLTARGHQILDLVIDNDKKRAQQAYLPLLSTCDAGGIEIESVDIPGLTCTLKLPVAENQHRLSFSLVEHGGRYLRISGINAG